MPFMNKFSLAVVFVSLSGMAAAQTVTVRKQSEKSIDGYATELAGKRADVNSTLNKILREHGKIKLLSSDPTVVTNPILKGVLYAKGILYATTKENADRVTVWIGMKPSEWGEAEISTVDEQVKQLVYDMGIQFYRDQAQAQIDQTQQAADAVARQHLRAINLEKDLIKKLENNAQDKIKLENAIEANKLENLALKVRIEKSRKAQDSLAAAGVTIQQLKEVHIDKLRKVN